MFGDYDLILTQWFMQPGVITVIGSKNGTPVGFAMLQLGNQRTGNALTGELLAIAVIPEQQNQGVGEALLHHVEDLVSGGRLRAIFLHTAKDNLPAQFLFQKAGYRIAGWKGGYYPKGQAAVRMVKMWDQKQ